MDQLFDYRMSGLAVYRLSRLEVQTHGVQHRCMLRAQQTGYHGQWQTQQLVWGPTVQNQIATRVWHGTPPGLKPLPIQLTQHCHRGCANPSKKNCSRKSMDVRCCSAALKTIQTLNEEDCARDVRCYPNKPKMEQKIMLAPLQVQ